MTPSGDMTVLHEFSGGSDGAHPIGDLVQASDGSFYGATYGAYSNPNRVFRMSPGGIVTPHYQFSTQHGNVVSLVGGTDGVLFGTTDWSIFSLTLNGVFTTLAAFDYRTDGIVSRVVEASNGNLYGMTTGKFNGSATIFTLRRDGTGFNVIATLPSQADWEGPYQLGGLIQASDGNLYGTIPRGLGELSSDSAESVARRHGDGTPPFHRPGMVSLQARARERRQFLWRFVPVGRPDGSRRQHHNPARFRFESLRARACSGKRRTSLWHDPFWRSTRLRRDGIPPEPVSYTFPAGPGYRVGRRHDWRIPSMVARGGRHELHGQEDHARGAAVVIASGITGLSFTDTTASLAAGASYVVFAVNLAGESLPSTAVSASRTPPMHHGAGL